MAPMIFHLIACTAPASLISRLATLKPDERPLYIGECHHWIREPSLSGSALLGKTSTTIPWRLLIIYAPAAANDDSPACFTLFHSETTSSSDHFWFMTADVSDDLVSAYQESKHRRAHSPPPPLPPGWSAHDPSGLHASSPPPDLEFSLTTTESFRLGAERNECNPIVLKDTLAAFGTGEHAEQPVFMLNIISSNPGQRARTHAYFGHFAAWAGPKYGGEGIVLGSVLNWSSRLEEGELTVEGAEKLVGGGNGGGGGAAAADAGDGELDEVGWEDVGLVYYPSVWHFAKLLDDPEYAQADRKYKQGALRDGPILMCTEVDVDYQE